MFVKINYNNKIKPIKIIKKCAYYINININFSCLSIIKRAKDECPINFDVVFKIF